MGDLRGMFMSMCLLLCAAAIAHAELEHASAVRTIDLTSCSVVRETIRVTIVNTGTAAVDTYKLLIDQTRTLARIEVKGKDDGAFYTIAQSAAPGQYDVKLLAPLGGQESLSLVITAVYIHAQDPLPKAVKQTERQLVVFETTLNFYTPYVSQKDKTTLIVPSGSHVESRTGYVNSSVDRNKYIYGVYTAIAPKSEKPLRIHYVNNSPCLAVEKMERLLEISHWGSNLAVENHYTVLHTGAALLEPFNRAEYARSAYSHGNTGMVKEFEFQLPAGAHDAYYRDLIGNISTSNFRSELTKSVLQLQPRFPLFGTWHTYWFHGYNLPLQSVLGITKTGSYVLTVQFAELFKNAAVHDFTLRVVLPEGARNIQFHSNNVQPDVQEFDVTKTYLDTYGRPTLIVRKKNVVNEHDVLIQITYDFATIMMLQEPFLVVAFFFLLFIMSMIYVRLDFTIARNAAADALEKERSLIANVLNIQNAKERIYEELDSALEAFKAGKKTALQDAQSRFGDLKNQAELASAASQQLEGASAKLAQQLLDLEQSRVKLVQKLHADVQSAHANPSKKDHLAASIQAGKDDLSKKIVAIQAVLSELAKL